MIDLQIIAHEIRVCSLCLLANSRTKAVPGEGSAKARLMFIGEAPGREEDAQGRPFIGHSGRLFNEALRSAGIERSEVFITNVVKCRPPNNRIPRRNEVDSCVGAHLYRQIQALNPEFICLLGGTAVKALLGVDHLGSVRGSLIVKDRQYFSTYHPAGAGRNSERRKAFQADLKKLKNLLPDKR